MGEAPQEFTVAAVSQDGTKVKVNGIDVPFDVVPKQPVSVGQELKGWLNYEGKYGPYLKIAAERSSSNGGASSEQGVIEGWAYNLAAQELAAGLEHADVAARAREILTSRAADQARGPSLPQPPSAQPAAKDLDSGQAFLERNDQSDSKIPF